MARVLGLALFISGKGSTAAAVMQACRTGALLNRVKPACAVMNHDNAEGLDTLMNAGMEPRDIHIIPSREYKGRQEEFGEAILKRLHQYRVDCIGQYGWMVKTPENVIREYAGVMINQHPGPLDPGRPDFGGKGMYGMRVHCARLLFCRWTNRDFWTEAVAQRVADEYDQGAVMYSRQVPILQEDDPYRLRERVLYEEYHVQITTLRMLAEGGSKVERRVTPLIRPEELPILERAKEIACMLFPKGS
ncbi:hypothetical protein HY620_01175 [Candidatus Uhrbacteria bacterium]|nr:hypothetical protein [Candidatus Uhrbacteria bacterium]